MESWPSQETNHTSTADLPPLKMNNMDWSASLPTLEWSVSCKVMGDVVENDDLLSLLKPYVSR